MARFNSGLGPFGLGHFDPAGRFVARRPFVYEGRDIARGDEIPIAATGEAKMRKLHNARYVECRAAPLPPPAEAPRPAPAPEAAPPAVTLYEGGRATVLPPPRALDMRGAVLAPPNEKRTGARPPRKRQGEASAADATPQTASAPARAE